MIDLYVPGGIGDIYWLLMKIFSATDESIHLRIPPGKCKISNRANFLLSLPQIEKITKGLPYSELLKCAKQYNKIERKMFVEANTWLEAGNHIEDYLPNFETSFKLPWRTTPKESEKVRKLLSLDKKNIIIYTSSFKNNNCISQRENWDLNFWVEFIDIVANFCNVIWIGANYDTDILSLIDQKNITILKSESSGLIISLLRNCQGFISYQSGLSCISVAEMVPTFMLFFRKLEKLSRSICPRISLDNEKIYYRAFFDSVAVEDAVKWVEGL